MIMNMIVIVMMMMMMMMMMIIIIKVNVVQLGFEVFWGSLFNRTS